MKTIAIALLLIASCGTKPCEFVCDETKTTYVYMYNVSIKSVISTPIITCLYGHYEQSYEDDRICDFATGLEKK